ncbi:hypothetical protein HN011_006234 [Eciton burchellii]|nr:hypothetical protein HN011_006234 [Eciton burchellii]
MRVQRYFIGREDPRRRFTLEFPHDSCNSDCNSQEVRSRRRLTVPRYTIANTPSSATNATEIDLENHDSGNRTFSREIRAALLARILSGFLPRGVVPVTRKSSQMFARNPRRPLPHERGGPARVCAL